MLDVFRRHFDSLGADGVLSLFEDYLKSSGTCVVGGILSTAWKTPPDTGTSGFITGRLMLKETVETPRAMRVYPSVTLEEKWIEHDELVRLLRALLADEKTELFPELFHAPSVERIYTVGTLQTYSGWSEIHVKLTCKANRAEPEWLPAVARSLTPYRTWPEAVGRWVFDRATTYGPDLPHVSQLLVVLPDTRARPLGISEGNNGINVCVEVRSETELVARDDAAAVPEFELQYVFSSSRARLEGTAPIQSGCASELPFAPEATQLDVFCIHQTDGFISHRAYAWVELQDAGATPHPDDEGLLNDISAGERGEVEFKPFIQENHPKGRELVKAVIAFANTDGGRVYVGITDEGEPEGRKALRHFQSAEDHDGRPTQIAQLRKLISDQIKPVPQTTFRMCEVGGQPIVVLEVAAGLGYVCTTHENDCYIRKGSTNRKPDLTTELAPLMSRRDTSTVVASIDEFL